VRDRELYSIEKARALLGGIARNTIYELMRVRPIMMTVAAIIGGLLPIMWGSGTGSEVMRRIAAPMVGGMVSVTVLALIVIPAIYAVVKEVAIRREGA